MRLRGRERPPAPGVLFDSELVHNLTQEVIMEYEIFPYQFDSYTEETTLRSQVVEGDQGSRTKTDMLRVDHLIDSRHKYLSPDPQTVVVEHEGEEYQLALPKNSPACDFLLSAVTGDFLFLIGSQHPGRDGETYRGALVVARSAKMGSTRQSSGTRRTSLL